MDSAKSILLVGPSSLPFTEEGEDGKLANLIGVELRRRRPDIDWRIDGITTFQGPGMVARLKAAYEKYQPDVLYLKLTTYHLTHEYVLWKLKDRWPRLYPAAKFVDARMQWLAGGPRDRANTPRPWVYSLPRGLAQRVVGQSTQLPVPECLASIEESLDYLLAREDTHVSVWVSSSAFRPRQRDKTEYEENSAALWKGVFAYAERRRVPVVSSLEMRRHFGLADDYEKTRAADGIHSALDWRRMQAKYIALKALDALQLSSAQAVPAMAR